MIKTFYWTPRIITIVAILFLMMFSADCFESADYSLKEKVICLTMHNIPSFILIAILIFAWKWESPGGILLMTLSTAGSIFFDGFATNTGVLIITAPFFIAGILFVISGSLSKNEKKQELHEK